MKKIIYQWGIISLAIIVLLLVGIVPVYAANVGGHGGYHGGGYHGGGYRGYHGGYRGGWHGGGYWSGGIWIGGPWWGWGPWWDYPYYYPYDYSDQPIYLQQQSPVYDQQQAPQEQQMYWYFCPDAKAYYPYVKQCPGGWLKVVPPPAQGQGPPKGKE
ncbi:MAG TPA: hypothetical protein VL122_08725 [Nitrospirota bacterium]|nr:hypothetical protein [Nitrospirota bacterium]